MKFEGTLTRPDFQSAVKRCGSCGVTHALEWCVQPAPSLFDPDAVQARPLTLDERFDRFHAAHPEVYRELRRLAHQARNAGRTRIGMKQLFEVLRWERMLAGLPDETEGWKLNNSYSSRYARLLMDREPELAGMFEIRELKT